MNRNELKYLIYCDLYRYCGTSSKKVLFKKIFYKNKNLGLRFVIEMRLLKYLKNKKRNLFVNIFYHIIKINYESLKVKSGIQIGVNCNIGEGLSIPHYGNIVVADNCLIGKNCTILQGVTIGANTFKNRYKCAEIGDNVVIGAGAKLIGPVRIGNNVTIGANSVVTSDIQDNCVVGGIPAKVLSNKKSILINGDYLSREEYGLNDQK